MTPAEALRKVSALRSRAQAAEKFAEVASPRVGLSVKVGTYDFSHDTDLIEALRDAALVRVRDLTAEADALEARVVLVGEVTQ